MHRAFRVVIDLVLVVAFAALGRASHQEALDPAGMARTAVPFLGGTLLVWIFLVLTNRRFTPLREGTVVWASTLVLGLLFRVMVGDGAQPAFVAVTAAVLAAFLIGWRALWWLATRGRGGPARRADPGRSGNPAVREQARRKR